MTHTSNVDNIVGFSMLCLIPDDWWSWIVSIQEQKRVKESPTIHDAELKPDLQQSQINELFVWVPKVHLHPLQHCYILMNQHTDTHQFQFSSVVNNLAASHLQSPWLPYREGSNNALYWQIQHYGAQPHVCILDGYSKRMLGCADNVTLFVQKVRPKGITLREEW